jgi:MerR family transcriptional regulator, redox-sensitive transcriptional activator SoxR
VGSRELTIGELAARSGVAPSALRFYEAAGLIASQRTSGNQRRYERSTLRRVAFIQAGKAAGIPLKRIGAALATLPSERAPAREDWERLSTGWRDDLDRRIATLEALRGRLTTCIGCGCLSIDACDLLNPDDEASELGAGAHYLRQDRDGVSGSEPQAPAESRYGPASASTRLPTSTTRAATGADLPLRSSSTGPASGYAAATLS